jgi:hypothetical protein
MSLGESSRVPSSDASGKRIDLKLKMQLIILLPPTRRFTAQTLIVLLINFKY